MAAPCGEEGEGEVSKGARMLSGLTLMVLLCVPLFLLDVPREAFPGWTRYVLTAFYFSLYALTMSYALRGYEASREEKRRSDGGPSQGPG